MRFTLTNTSNGINNCPQAYVLDDGFVIDQRSKNSPSTVLRPALSQFQVAQFQATQFRVALPKKRHAPASLSGQSLRSPLTPLKGLPVAKQLNHLQFLPSDGVASTPLKQATHRVKMVPYSLNSRWCVPDSLIVDNQGPSQWQAIQRS